MVYRHLLQSVIKGWWGLKGDNLRVTYALNDPEIPFVLLYQGINHQLQQEAYATRVSDGNEKSSNIERIILKWKWNVHSRRILFGQNGLS